MPLTPWISAPAAEQSTVAPFFERSSPRCGSRLFGLVAKLAALVFAPPLSGNPMPPSQAEVTMRLPAGYGAPVSSVPQSPLLPMKTKGSAVSLPLPSSSSSASASPGAASANTAVAMEKERHMVISPLSCYLERVSLAKGGQTDQSRRH